MSIAAIIRLQCLAQFLENARLFFAFKQFFRLNIEILTEKVTKSFNLPLKSIKMTLFNQFIIELLQAIIATKPLNYLQYIVAFSSLINCYLDFLYHLEDCFGGHLQVPAAKDTTHFVELNDH